MNDIQLEDICKDVMAYLEERKLSTSEVIAVLDLAKIAWSYETIIDWEKKQKEINERRKQQHAG